MLLLGVPWTLLLAPFATGFLFWAVAFLLGTAYTGMGLLAIAGLGFKWTAVSVGLTLFVPFAIGAAFAIAKLKADVFRIPFAGLAGYYTGSYLDLLLTFASDLMLLYLICGYTIVSSIAPLGEWDFWAIWGLKARMFYIAQGIDWNFLSDYASYIHADYPILFPLIFDFMCLIMGKWDDQQIGFLLPGYGAAGILALRHFLSKDMRSCGPASLATLALASACLSPWIGLADGPFIAFSLIACLLIRFAIRQGDMRTLMAGALLLGCTASIKIEGYSLIIAVVVALALDARTRLLVWRLWPALLVVAPWTVLRMLHGYSNYLGRGNVTGRIATHLSHPGPFLRVFAENLPRQPLFWAFCLVALAVWLRPIWRRDRFLLLTAMLLLGSYIASYLVTPHNLAWHVQFSWARLLSHVAPLLGYVVLVQLADVAGLRRSATEGDSTANPPASANSLASLG